MDFDNVLSMPEMERYVRSLAASAKLKVRWIEPGEGVYCNRDTLFMPRFAFPLNRDAIIRNLHAAEHEVSHIVRSDFDMLEELNCHAGNSFLGYIQNAVEDHRIEYLPAQEYAGTAKVLDEGYDTLTKSLVAEMEKPGVDQAMVDVIRPLLQFDAEARSDWQTSPIGRDYMANASPKSREYWKKFQEHPEILDMMREVRELDGRAASWKAHELAKYIYETVYDKDAEAELKRLADAKPAPEGKGGEGEGEEGEGEGEDGEGRGALSKSAEDGKDYSEFAATPKHSTDPKDGKPTSMPGADGTGKYEPCPLMESNVVNFAHPDRSIYNGEKHHVKAGSADSIESHGYYGDDILRSRSHDVNSAVFAAKLRSILQVRSQKHYSFGHKSGKLHGASLHRSELGMPGVSERVFKRKHESNTLDTAIAVAVDMSGSMHGDKIRHAADAAALLNASLGNVLKMPLFIYGFSGDARADLFVLRDFDENIVPEQTFMKRAARAVDLSMNQNLDGEAVLFGFEALRSAKAKRRLLIVLSDGYPACSRPGNARDFLKEVARKIEASPVELVGIGIMTPAVKRFYKDSYTINSARELEPALLATIKSKLL